MTYHGAVEAVLCHYCRSAPAFLRFPPLGPPVLEPNLNSILGQVSLQREHFTCINVGIMSFLEGLLQLLQLITGENRPVPSLFLLFAAVGAVGSAVDAVRVVQFRVAVTTVPTVHSGIDAVV